VDETRGAGLLHRLTSTNRAGRDQGVPSYDRRRRPDAAPEDLDRVPPAVKAYGDEVPVIPLPPDLPPGRASATAVLAGLGVEPRPLTVTELARLLFLSAGVVRTTGTDPRLLYRAAGSAGARYPLEVYVSARGVIGLPDAVYWYDPVRHALRPVGPAARGRVTTVVVTGIPWRTGWRYAERGWRHLYWDAGTTLSHLMAVAEGSGLRPRLRTTFPDAAVRELVGADGVHEYPLALLSLGEGEGEGGGEPAIEPSGRAVAGELAGIEMPLCTEAQQAGESRELGPAWPEAPPLADAPASAPLDTVILRRSSQRRMVRGATVPRSLLEWPLRAALRGIEIPHWVVAHGVEGVEPGVHRWPRLDDAVGTRSRRDELTRICLGQELAGDAAYVVVAAVDGRDLDDRSYRAAQLAAGLVEGRLHLAAYAWVSPRPG
jgi:SagB-type dehydrogenase family enzyme